MIYEGHEYRATGKSIPIGALTEGVEGDDVKTVGCQFFMAALDVQKITGHIELQLEGYRNGKWYTVESKNITADGTYLMQYHYAGLFLYMRVYWSVTVKAQEADEEPTVVEEVMVA